MLKIITSLAIFAIVMPADAQSSEFLAPFSKITVGDGIEVVYQQGLQSSIEVKNPGRFVISDLKMSVKNGSLEISNHENPDIMIKIVVKSPTLTAVKASGKSKFTMSAPFHNEAFTLSVSSGAVFCGTVITEKADLSAKSGSVINIKLDATSLAGNFDSNAKVNISGSAKISDIHTSGSALCLARNFVADSSQINASGNSTAMVYAANELDLIVTEKATVRYFGVPRTLSVNPETISMLRSNGESLATN